MNSYTDFAYIYDSLMHKDIDYEKWADYIENLFIMYDINPDLVCDLACGTGNIKIPPHKERTYYEAQYQVNSGNTCLCVNSDVGIRLLITEYKLRHGRQKRKQFNGKLRCRKQG